MDIIAKTAESSAISQYISELYSQGPLPWDQKGEYTAESSDVYYEISEHSLMKIPK